MCAGEYSNRSSPNCEERRKKIHEFLVCCAVYGWCGQAHLDCVAVQSTDLCATRAWLDMALLRLGRLSVQPVTPEEFEIVTKLGDLNP